MLIFSLYLLLAFAVAAWARSWGRDFGGALFLSLLLSPVLYSIILLIGGDKGRRCPNCAETVKPEAVKCKHCGSDLPAIVVPVTSIENQDSGGGF